MPLTAPRQTLAPREPALGPPAGFRPHMGVTIKLEAACRLARCPDCGERLGSMANVQADHDPPIQQRLWNPITEDTIPAANDPDHIVLRHVDCHAVKTNGPRTKARAQGDKTEIARTTRLTEDQQAFRTKMITGVKPAPAKPKQRIQSRGFQRRKK